MSRFPECDRLPQMDPEHVRPAQPSLERNTWDKIHSENGYLRLSYTVGSRHADIRAFCLRHGSSCTWTMGCNDHKPIGALWYWLNAASHTQETKIGTISSNQLSWKIAREGSWLEIHSCCSLSLQTFSRLSCRQAKGNVSRRQCGSANRGGGEHATTSGMIIRRQLSQTVIFFVGCLAA